MIISDMAPNTENGLPIPIFGCNGERESPLAKPFLADWIATSRQTLTEWKGLPKAVAQLLDFKIDSFSNEIYVKISDGSYWIPAVVLT